MLRTVLHTVVAQPGLLSFPWGGCCVVLPHGHGGTASSRPRALRNLDDRLNPGPYDTQVYQLSEQCNHLLRRWHRAVSEATDSERVTCLASQVSRDFAGDRGDLLVRQ